MLGKERTKIIQEVEIIPGFYINNKHIQII